MRVSRPSVARMALEVHAYSSGGQHLASGFGNFFGTCSVTRFHIRGDWNVHSVCDAAHDPEHLRARDSLAIRVAETVGDAGAGGADGGKSGFLENTGAGDVPYVWQDQRLRAVVQRQKLAREFR